GRADLVDVVLVWSRRRTADGLLARIDIPGRVEITRGKLGRVGRISRYLFQQRVFIVRKLVGKDRDFRVHRKFSRQRFRCAGWCSRRALLRSVASLLALMSHGGLASGSREPALARGSPLINRALKNS